MQQAAAAALALNEDFWPANDLATWQADPMTAFTHWLAQHRVYGVRHMRETSCETYEGMFVPWVRFLSDRNLSLLEATPLDACSFFMDIYPLRQLPSQGVAPDAKKGLRPVSRRRYLQLLDRVYRHLRDIGWSGLSPFREELAREGELDIQLPQGLSDEHLRHFETYLRSIPGWKGSRDRGLAALLLGAGLRTNEAIALQVGAVSERFSLRVVPEGVHREHTTLILPDGPWREWHLSWQAARTELQIPGSVLCPATLKGVAFCASGLYRRVHGWLMSLPNPPVKKGAHILRNTFAQQAVACGRYELETIQEFLGHEELRATARYQAAASSSAGLMFDACSAASAQ